MSEAWFKAQLASSPAFVIDFDRVMQNLRPLLALRETSGCNLLYSVKALPLAALLQQLAPILDGFSVSSLFEARLAREVLGERGSVHLTTPGLRADEFDESAALCSHIGFNSLSQMRRLMPLAGGYSAGLRINPKLSLVDDERYDPCRQHSKLGVDSADLAHGLPSGITGLQLHNVFGQRSLEPLLQTLSKIQPLLEQHSALQWLNLGGGYLFSEIADLQPLSEVIGQLRQHHGLEIFLEPGKALVGNAGYLLTTVLDRFDSDGKTVLVLDTSVNHHPEVFEYQRQPHLLEHDEQGDHAAILAGSSCLAGDVFGEYRFHRLPNVGESLVFADVGAYSLIKANRFNGYNFPDVYSLQHSAIRLEKALDYSDYLRQWL